ncbi:KH domain-containing protein [Aquihabitans sp. G128]|uniref:KH domain-containing protein n=1 Tax=Aquihabitans sp. G128 TaxID=2849779 RepID=UPI001C23947D|nr:KH domain-containing protein [Aquihabitans sp. G128]QXC62621.1 KH domain-containing protein [Aquihabitans sp. G128]
MSDAETTDPVVDEVVEDDAAAEGGEPAANAKSVLEYLVKQVVDDPEAVSVSTSEGRRGGIQLDVRVGEGDMGRVIGKRGRIAQSIRTVVRAAAVKDDTTVDIEFVD